MGPRFARVFGRRRGRSSMDVMPQTSSAGDFLPPERNLKAMRMAAAHCEGCDLFKNGTRTVFGEGPRRAPLVLIGETPGDREEQAGKPFVGPAGKLLDQVL